MLRAFLWCWISADNHAYQQCDRWKPVGAGVHVCFCVVSTLANHCSVHSYILWSFNGQASANPKR